MFDKIVSFMNQFQAGSVLVFLAGVFYVCMNVWKFVSNLLNKHTSDVTSNIRTTEEKEQMKTDINHASEELEVLSRDLHDSVNELTEKIENHVSLTMTQRNELLDAIKDLRDIMEQQQPKNEGFEDRLVKIEHQIAMLFESDKQYITAYITEVYNKYVKTEKCIDLITLQNVEGIYNRFLSETGAEDEFLSKLLRDLRNLPTTKDEEHK